MLSLSFAALGLTFFSLNVAAVPLASPGMLETHPFMPCCIPRKLTNVIRSHRIAY